MRRLSAILVLAIACSNGSSLNDTCAINPTAQGCEPPPPPAVFNPGALAAMNLPDSVNLGDPYPCNGDDLTPDFTPDRRDGIVGVLSFFEVPSGRKERFVCSSTAGRGSPAFMDYFGPRGQITADTEWIKIRYELGVIANRPVTESPNPLYDVLEHTIYTRGFPRN